MSIEVARITFEDLGDEIIKFMRQRKEASQKEVPSDILQKGLIDNHLKFSPEDFNREINNLVEAEVLYVVATHPKIVFSLVRRKPTKTIKSSC